jgi:transglutaminase-like putative cysteine protease
MRTLRIVHRTRYSYDRPVFFGEHRLMIRPRDAHDMRILDSSLTVSPRADVHWAFDTFGNSVTLLSFHEPADELVISSELLLRRYGLDAPLARFGRFAGGYPVVYDADERIDLASLMAVECPQDRPAVEEWLAGALPDRPGESLRVLDMLGAAMHRSFAYRRCEEIGVQTPGRTIAAGSGTCRDFAFLFMEAARALGFAARFVTGYLYDPGADDPPGEAMSGGGATHAWADIFVPGAGWIEFDPTNRIVAGRNLIRVATTRTPAQASPVSGAFADNGGVCTAMAVSVTVSRSD